MSEDLTELTAKIDARQKNPQDTFMEYRLVVVHDGRRSKCWVRYSVMEQLHQRIKSDTRGLTFPRKLFCTEKAYDSIPLLPLLSFASRQPKATFFAIQLPISVSLISTSTSLVW